MAKRCAFSFHRAFICSQRNAVSCTVRRGHMNCDGMLSRTLSGGWGLHSRYLYSSSMPFTRAVSTGQQSFRKRIIARSTHFHRPLASERRPPQGSFGERGQTFRIGLLFIGVIGGGIYLLARYRINQSYCETEQEKLELSEVTDVSERSRNGLRQRLSLQEAIAEAQLLCTRVKEESGSPGLVVAVSINGKQVWAQGLGVADIENHVPCKADTVMRIASISKPLTMTAVAKAVEKDQLDIDKPVQAYVPKFPEKTVDGEKVTLTTRHLVSQMGGIRHYSKEYFQKKANTDKKDTSPSSTSQKASPLKTETSDPRDTLQLSEELDDQEYFLKDHFDSTEAALTLFQNDPLVHKPGSKYLYTTHGWTLIAAVLEGATKRKFTDITVDLFRDLGLENTYLDDHQPLIYNRSSFYLRDKKNVLVNAPYVDCSYKYAGGGMLSTAPDLVKFGNAMLYSYQFQDSKAHSHGHKNGESKQTECSLGISSVTSSSKASDSSSKTAASDEGRTVVENTPAAKAVFAEKMQESPAKVAKIPGYLKPSTMRKIWKPVPNTDCDGDKDDLYAMGWRVSPERQKVGCGRHQRFYVYHTGGAVGASSVLLILPPPRAEELSKGGDLADLPRGVVVAMIVNMISVSLSKTALKIANIFENIEV